MLHETKYHGLIGIFFWGNNWKQYINVLVNINVWLLQFCSWNGRMKIMYSVDLFNKNIKQDGKYMFTFFEQFSDVLQGLINLVNVEWHTTSLQ